MKGGNKIPLESSSDQKWPFRMLFLKSAFGLVQSLIHSSHRLWMWTSIHNTKLVSILTPNLYFLYHKCQFKCTWNYREPDNWDSHNCHKLSVCFCYHLLFSSQTSASSLNQESFSGWDFCDCIHFLSFSCSPLSISICTMPDFAVIKQNSLPKESTKTTTWSQAAGNIWKTILHLDAVSFIYFSFASLFLFYTVDSKF